MGAQINSQTVLNLVIPAVVRFRHADEQQHGNIGGEVPNA
jgi:hypothetical protein